MNRTPAKADYSVLAGGGYNPSMLFFESLQHQANLKGGPLCVGIDPRVERGPDVRGRILDYGRRVVEACAPHAVAFKPQLAFFECHGAVGWSALEDLLSFIRSLDPEFPVILDGKRGDIGSTAEAYARALLDRPGVLAVTLSPYLGRDSVQPFLNRSGRGAFILCRTTNPGAARIQERLVEGELPLFLAVADEAVSWNPDAGKPSIGLVVAGNDVESLASVRRRHPGVWFLAPGIGAQGGQAEQAIAAGSRDDGWGVLVSASRSVADDPNPAEAARKLKDELNRARERTMLGRGGRTRSRSAAVHPESPSSGMSASDRRELLDGFYRVGAFRCGSFTLKSGKVSPFYLDLRRLGSDPHLLRLCGRAYAGMLNAVDADRLAAIPVAALPLAAAAALETGLGLIYPRLEPKSHGTGERVEGIWSAGEKAVMLDDLITTGGSKREAAEVLRGAGLRVGDLVVLIERGSAGRRDMEEIGIRLHAWADIDDLLTVGLAGGYLDGSIADEIRDFVREG